MTGAAARVWPPRSDCSLEPQRSRFPGELLYNGCGAGDGAVSPTCEGTMSALSLLLNLLWLVFGGVWMAAGWVIAAIIMAITIIGIPWARAAFNIAAYTLLPFGQKAVSRAQYSGSEDVGTGPLGVIGNIIWLVLAGWWLALGHLITAILLAITIVGIPFAWAHWKLAGIALWPIGKMIVPADPPPR
jgi:uncharacterized membrane protein YccF (DUF307 family)